MLRLSQISIENFKNVLQGTINLTTLPEGPSILGLYGQNGSGKTSLIEAIELLKYLLQGKSLPASFADYIHVDSPYARVIYEFEMSLPNESEQDKSYLLRYEVSIRAAGSSSTQTDGPFQSPDHTPSTTASANQPGLAVEVFSEVLRYSELQANGRHGRLTTLIDTVSSVKPFGPASKAALLFGKDHPAGRSLRTDLEYHMRFARWTGRSAILCDEFQRLLQEAPDHTAVPASLIGAVHDYGRNGLFVISKSDIGEISLPDGTLIPMDRSVTISTVSETELRYVVDGMNLVLGEIVPGLGIGHRILSRELMSDGREGVQIQLVSEKNEKTIPL
ncbi:MAG: AAA family ATPase, partial [Firmicutes bacterium]|nr:AAA family ATPase [Bacillota bacterium]